jgi:hypothetical protein
METENPDDSFEKHIQSLTPGECERLHLVLRDTLIHMTATKARRRAAKLPTGTPLAEILEFYDRKE